MKRFVLLILTFLILYVLVTRFIYVENSMQLGTPPPADCLPAGSSDQGGVPCEVLAEINQEYVDTIKPIFAAKCLMCHGVPAELPLYSKIPPSSYLVQYDMKEAKEDLNMSWDFPFVDYKGPKHSLKEVLDVVEENEMPPLVYKILHWESGLSPEEKQKILHWAKDGLKRLQPYFK